MRGAEARGSAWAKTAGDYSPWQQKVNAKSTGLFVFLPSLIGLPGMGGDHSLPCLL